MFAGVTFNFFVINAAVTTELFLLTRSFLALPAALAIHAVGYFLCLREPPRLRSLADQGQPLPPGAQLQALGLQQLFALRRRVT